MITIDNFSQIIKKHKWENRVLLVYAEDKNDSTFQKQIKDFKQNTAALNDRKLIIYLFTNDTYQILNDAKLYSIDNNHPFKNEKSSFKITLIGLDGTVKFTSLDFTASTKIFEIIDAMPMRIREVRNKN